MATRSQTPKPTTLQIYEGLVRMVDVKGSGNFACEFQLIGSPTLTLSQSNPTLFLGLLSLLLHASSTGSKVYVEGTSTVINDVAIRPGL